MPSLIAPLRASLQQHAHRTAVEGANWLLSYRDLDRESERLGQVLRAAGVGRGHLVPMLMGRSPHFIVAMLAVLRCGAAYAPIDLASPPARQAAMLAVLDSPVALVDPAIDTAPLHGRVALVVAEVLARPLPATPTPTSRANGTGVPAAGPCAGGDPLPWPDTPAHEVAYAMFTSGSTGTPKCVLVPHGGVARLVVDADYANFGADSRWTQLASLAFDAATLEIWAPLLNGACCVIQELALPSLDDLADYFIEREITDAWLTAALFNAMVDDRIDALGGLQQLLLGGERISVAHARACLLRWPNVRLINGYGPTENTTFSLCHTIALADVTPPADGAAGGRALQVPIGRPIRGTLARVVPLSAADAEAGSVVDADEWQPGAGELWVAGAGVAIGYLNDPGLTAAKFVARDGQRWYRTGDVVAERADGVFEFFGRADRQVKIQGHRIELEEVERVLANCPGVGNAVVLVVGDSADSRHLVGCYCGLGGTGSEPAPAGPAVRQYLNERLSPKAVPNALHAFERLPLNLNGKVDRAALGRLIASRATATDAAPDVGVRDGAVTAAWHTETERQLAAIWSRCMPHARLDRLSHFTHAGGSSLLALRVAADVGRGMQRRLDALDVLRQPVLADQARLIDAAGPFQPAEASDASPAPERFGRRRTRGAAGATPVQLSRSQKSLLQASRLDASGCAYLVHVALQLAAPLSPGRLRAALAEVVARHPMLRTAATLEGDAVAARVLPRLPDDWWRDSGELALAPAEFDWPATVLELINQPGDWSVDGPMRVHQWSLPDGEHLCVWTVHHFAMDEASIYQALGELDALLRGQPLAPVYGSPFAFEAIESAWTDDAALAAQAAGFVAALQAERRRDGDGAPLSLPMPLPPAPRRGAEAPVPLAAAAASGQALARAAARWGCTPFTPLVVAYGLALQQVFGPAWRFVLTPFSRRAEPELIEPIGCLLDVRLIEAGARAGESLPQTVRRVHGELLDGLQPRFRPLDRLADAVAAIDPELRAALTQFSITWRPERRAVTQLAGVPVRVLNVPQSGARFGITLHVEADAAGAIDVRTEAVDEAIAAGRVAALARVFAQQLDGLCALTAVDLSPAPAPSSLADRVPFGNVVSTALGGMAALVAGRANAVTPPAAATDALVRHAGAAWQRWLGQAPAGPAHHFLVAGGSSLLAMRLAATLRREAGVALDVAAFLARPTFGALCSLLAATPRASAHTVTLVGARNYAQVLLLLPGGEGGPLGMFHLAQELHGRLPEQWAVAIVDLPAIMRRAPDGQRSSFFAQQLLQVVRDLGEDRIGSIAGFSLGGLLAVDLLKLLAPERAAAIPLWLIDTYAPQRMRIGRAALLQRAAINLLRHPLETARLIVARLRGAPAGTDDPDARPEVLRDAGIGNLTPKWRAFMGELSKRRFDAGGISATLIHSRSWARTSGLLRHIGTNGFAPRTFGQLRVVVVDEPHFELPRSGAARVAGLITGRA